LALSRGKKESLSFLCHFCLKAEMMITAIEKYIRLVSISVQREMLICLKSLASPSKCQSYEKKRVNDETELPHT
jgi:hypothetical protein